MYGRDDGIGGTQYHLRQIFVFLDAHVLNKPETMVCQIGPKIDPQTGELIDPVTRDFISGQLSAFAAFARR